MAKVNPVKVKQDADKEEKAGRLEKAVQLYRQLLDDNPRDWNTINKIGDLYARMNRMQEAASEYAKVADFYAKDGFHLKAIAIWKKINKLDASALDPYLKLADLYAKQGLMMEAKSQYQIVVDEFIKRGKTKDAGDVLRRLAEIDPSDLKLRSKLADLYTREGQPAKAIDEMVAIAEELNRKGHLAEAVQVLEKGLKVDPGSGKLRGELARAYVVQKNFSRAAEVLEEVLRSAPNDVQALAQLGDAYLASNRIGDAERVFKRLLQQSPENPEVRAQMARLLLAQGKLDAAHEELLPLVDRLVDRGEAEKAAGLLQQLAQRDPAHVKTLVKLVDVYRQLKNDRAVAATYSQLTESYIKTGQLEQAASILEILISMEPQNQQHQSKLNFVRSKLGVRAASAPVIDEGLELDPEVPFAAEVPSLARGPAPAAGSPPPIEPSGPLSEEDTEFIEEHLAEGKVFRKYGLIDKAADQFEAVVARFPDHLETRHELLDVFKEKGQPAKAAEQALAVAQIQRLRGDEAAAEAATNEARELAPELVPVAWQPPQEEALAEVVEPGPEPELAEAVFTQGEEEISLPEPEEEIPLEVEEGGLDASAIESAEEALPSLEVGADAFTELEPAPAEITGTNLALEDSAFSPGPTEPEEALEAAPEEPAFEAPAIGEEELQFDPGVAEPPAPSPLRAAPAKPTAPAQLAADVPADLHKALDEVSSYVSLGFVDDAKEALRELAQKYPGHPAILDKTLELGLDLQPEAEPHAPAPPPEPPAPEPPVALAVEPEPVDARDAGPEPPSLESEAQSLAAELDLGSPAELAPPGFDPLAELSAEPADSQTEAGPDAAEPIPSFEAPPAPSGGIDLGAELGDLFSAQSAEEPSALSANTELGDAGLAEIFKEFKKGVDKQLSKEDYDTRYNLGIAYKEMGLIDEAIAEFQLAAKDELRLLECSSMLGICFLDKGMPKLAVKWFEKGLKAPNRANEEYQGLRYDLAMAHEAAGDRAIALSLFEDLYGQDASFRDVAQKLRELRTQS